MIDGTAGWSNKPSDTCSQQSSPHSRGRTVGTDRAWMDLVDLRRQAHQIRRNDGALEPSAVLDSASHRSGGRIIPEGVSGSSGFKRTASPARQMRRVLSICSPNSPDNTVICSSCSSWVCMGCPFIPGSSSKSKVNGLSSIPDGMQVIRSPLPGLMRSITRWASSDRMEDVFGADARLVLRFLM